MLFCIFRSGNGKRGFIYEFRKNEPSQLQIKFYELSLHFRKFISCNSTLLHSESDGILETLNKSLR